NMPFWKMLKEGNDHFELMRLEPKVDVCEKRYVFDAEPPANASPARALNFNPTGRCPAFEVPQELAQAVAEKQKADDVKVAELITRGTPVAPVKTGMDGGMHPAFQAKYKTSLVRLADGKVHTLVEERGGADPAGADTTVVSSTASSGAASGAGNFFTRLFGGGGSNEAEKPQPAPTVAQSAASPAAPKPAQVRTASTATKPAAKPESKPEPKQEARTQPPKPQQSAQASPAPQAAPPESTSAIAGNGLMAGAQPVVPTGSLESRWSAMRQGARPRIRTKRRLSADANLCSPFRSHPGNSRNVRKPAFLGGIFFTNCKQISRLSQFNSQCLFSYLQCRLSVPLQQLAGAAPAIDNVELKAPDEYRGRRATAARSGKAHANLPWQCLYLRPEPPGQCSLHPTLPLDFTTAG